MDSTLTIYWHVGQESAGNEPLRPERAYFYWRQGDDGPDEHTASFGRAQLEAEIRRLEEAGADTPPEFRKALAMMA
ncbi:MAG TPA: hypothetical protein VF756_16260 [Thermoanaerobaculia bacterium]